MGSYFGASWEAADGCIDLLDRNVQALRDQRNVRGDIFHLLAEEIAGDRRIVVDQQATFAVEEAASRGENRHLANPVGFGEDAVAVG